MFNNTVLTGGACRIHTHLEIFVVHLDLVEGEFQIGIHAEASLASAVILDLHIPQFHRVLFGDAHFLGCLDAAVVTFIDRIGHAVTAGIFGFLQGLAHRLPGYAPVIPILIVADIHIMSRPVHGYCIGAEPCNAVILR